MHRFRRYSSTLLIAALPSVAMSQTLVFDLGIAGGTETVRPGTYRLRLDNRLPFVSYSVSAIVRNIEIPPLANEALTAQQASILSTGQQCPAIIAAATRLVDAYAKKSESAVQTAVDLAWVAYKNTQGCVEPKEGLLLIIEMSRTNLPNVYTLKAGQELVVTVERPGAEGQPAVKWVKTFTTGPRGQWRATYGFAVAFTRLSAGKGIMEKQRAFFLETVKDTTRIRDRKDRSGADLVAAVLFHFMPTDAESRTFVGGPNAGISFDGTNPSIMGGYGWTYEQNVNLSFGLIARREAVLFPKYDVGQIVPSDLDEKQLTEMKLRVRPYVVLTLRLSTSPFSSGGKAQEEDGKQ